MVEHGKKKKTYFIHFISDFNEVKETFLTCLSYMKPYIPTTHYIFYTIYINQVTDNITLSQILEKDCLTSG